PGRRRPRAGYIHAGRDDLRTRPGPQADSPTRTRSTVVRDSPRWVRLAHGIRGCFQLNAGGSAYAQDSLSGKESPCGLHTVSTAIPPAWRRPLLWDACASEFCARAGWSVPAEAT